MSIYNKKQRDDKVRIYRKLTRNQHNRPKQHAYSKHLNFVVIPRRRHKQLCRQIVLGFEVEEMIFIPYPRKPTLYDCCL